MISDEPRTRLDLNLLEVFDVVMTERHVTRAAEHLGMTQSAVSNAINRLRKNLGDPLFKKAPRGVLPTPKALEIWPAISSGLSQLRSVVEAPGFNPVSSTQRFRVAIADLSAALLVPSLSRELEVSAPGVAVSCVPYEPSIVESMLLRGEVDFSIGNTTHRVSTLQSCVIWNDRYVVVARKNHPLFASGFGAEELARCRHLGVDTSGDVDAPSIVDEAFTRAGLRRRKQLTVNQFSIACSVLGKSDLVAILPERLVHHSSESEGLAVRSLPLDLPDPQVHLSWHRRAESHPAYMWFKSKVIESSGLIKR